MVQKNGPPTTYIKIKINFCLQLNYLDKPLGATSPDFESSFIGRGVEALSSMFESFELV